MSTPACATKRVLVSGKTPFDPNNEVAPIKFAACETTETQMDTYEKALAKKMKLHIPTPPLGAKLPRPDQAAVHVSADKADAYCKAEGGRLPMRVEWEKAARGPKGYDFATSDGTLKCGINVLCNLPGSTAVGVYKPNGFRIHDMTGGVWEWVKHSDGKTYICGGSRQHNNPGMLAASRCDPLDPNTIRFDIGFRCVWPQKTQHPKK